MLRVHLQQPCQQDGLLTGLRGQASGCTRGSRRVGQAIRQERQRLVPLARGKKGHRQVGLTGHVQGIVLFCQSHHPPPWHLSKLGKDSAEEGLGVVVQLVAICRLQLSVQIGGHRPGQSRFNGIARLGGLQQTQGRIGRAPQAILRASRPITQSAGTRLHTPQARHACLDHGLSLLGPILPKNPTRVQKGSQLTACLLHATVGIVNQRFKCAFKLHTRQRTDRHSRTGRLSHKALRYPVGEDIGAGRYLFQQGLTVKRGGWPHCQRSVRLSIKRSIGIQTLQR